MKPYRLIKSGLCWLTLLMCAASNLGALSTQTTQTGAQAAFFQNLKRLCGRQFDGETIFPTDKDHPLVGKRLVISFSTCSEREIRIPFQVDEDKSRTWVLTLTDQGLLLKHDHRHADGTPDRITMYGGYATASGTPHRQSFPADAATAKLIPEATSNVWTIELDSEKKQLVYYLERDGKPRYKGVFNTR